MALTLDDLRPGYESLFKEMTILPQRLGAAGDIVSRIDALKDVYRPVMLLTAVPWQIVGVIHAMESSLNLKTHLHNGDPLIAKTQHVPKGRPTGSPPFTWAESATDAIKLKDYDDKDDWDLATTLFRLEKYNGMGYRRSSIGIPSPYLWSFSNHYTKGKFASDGQYDPQLVSKQCGAAVLLRTMIDRGIFDFTAIPHRMQVYLNDKPLPDVSAFEQGPDIWIAPRPLSTHVTRLRVDAYSNDPPQISLAYRYGPKPHEEHRRPYGARLYRGVGHVSLSNLIGLMGWQVGIDNPGGPRRLRLIPI